MGMIVIALTLTGCAPAPDGQLSPTPTTDPTSTSTPTSTPTSAPTSSPTSEPDDPDDDQFTNETLSQICADATTSAFGTEVDFAIDDARIEERIVEPKWLVLVPAHTSDYTGEAQCTIGGTPASPIVGMASASLHPFLENQIQNLIKGLNEGGTD